MVKIIVLVAIVTVICDSLYENAQPRAKLLISVEAKMFSIGLKLFLLHHTYIWRIPYLQKNFWSPEASLCDRAWRYKRATKTKNECSFIHKIIFNCKIR